MKKYLLFVVCCLLFASAVHADVLSEVREGLDIRAARTTASVTDDPAIGELGSDVYASKHSNDTRDYTYVPRDFYLRVGGGTDIENTENWMGVVGFGWNASSYVRLELNGMYQRFGNANAVAGGATLYFDLARRYIYTGDIITRRTFVPFVGIGATTGNYSLDNDGISYVSPNIVVGFNIMFCDTVGLDLTYQYGRLTGHGLHENQHNGMASVRINF